MRKLQCVILAVAVASLVAGSVWAGPASKFAAQVSNLTLVPDTSSYNWNTVLQTTIKTPNKKDLLVGASFETGLYTQTKVKGKSGASDSANANATLKIRLLIDGLETVAYPNEVVYDYRSQTLNAVLGGVIESCQDTDGNGVIDVGAECTVSDEEIELILDTMAAHHFNFVVRNLTAGEHTVEVQAMIETGGVSGNGSYSAWASVGRGSLTVEEVRATNLPEGIEFLD